MSGADQVCQCDRNNEKDYSGLSLTKEKSKCCTEETTELSNTNNLLSFKTELPQDITSLGSLADNYSIDVSPNHIGFVKIIFDKPHYPNLDIPTLTSSLLI
ncbi:MAG: hypothetical protein K8I03_03505 [Ignavibacteria bacterium]|nr:hypothetical protein [Ignavibacteria bacterium]